MRTVALISLIAASACRASHPPVLEVTSATSTGAEVTTSATIPLDDWLEPPAAVRPTARWWWPGGSVDRNGMKQHLAAIRRAGFGAVEIQPLLLGLSERDLEADLKIRTVGSASFFGKLQSAAAIAATQGLAVDLTLGSGWPGGLPTGAENAERQLLLAAMDVSGPQALDAPLPPAPPQSARQSVERILDVMGPMDTDTDLVAVLAAKRAGIQGGAQVLSDVIDLTAEVQDGTLRWQVPPGQWQVMVLYTNTTAHFVLGGAYLGAATDAPVVDHLSRSGADALLEGFGNPAMAELPYGIFRSVFVDSFEMMGELPFTQGFLDAFQAQHGYDLTPHLPLVFKVGGESKYAESMDRRGRLGGPRYRAADPLLGQRVREDYEATREALFHAEFIQPIGTWARENGASLRLQAHGGYGDYLDTYAMSDIPESEGLFGDGSADFLSLAASAAHVSGQPWASAEAFIQLRIARTRLTPEEMDLLAGRAYAAGINRLVFHGLPYPYLMNNGRWWYPFPGGLRGNLAGPLPITTHFEPEHLETLSSLNMTLSRMSVAMSQGQPVAELAWLHSDPGYPDQPSFGLGKLAPDSGASPTTLALRAEALGHDRVSRRMLASATLEGGTVHIGAQQYQALLLDPLPVAEPELIERIASLAEAGVPVLALGALPARAPGLANASDRDRRVSAATQRLAAHVIHAQPDILRDQLVAHVQRDLLAPLPGAAFPFSMARRQTPNGEIVLLFNESWEDRTATMRFCRDGGAVTLWDPQSGTRTQVRDAAEDEPLSITLRAAQTLIVTVAQAE